MTWPDDTATPSPIPYQEPMRQHTLIALLHDRPGVLYRTVTLLRRRDYNIVSLAVGHSEAPGISRMTLAVDTNDAAQVVREISRLPDVLGVTDATNAPAIQREAALLKIITTGDQLSPIASAAVSIGGRVLALADGEIILEVTDTPERVEAFIDVMRPFGIAEIMRTGSLAMLRGAMPRPVEAPDDFREQADGAPHEEDDQEAAA